MPLVFQNFREGHGQPPAMGQMGKKSAGFWVPTRGACLTLLAPSCTSHHCTHPSVIFHFNLVSESCTPLLPIPNSERAPAESRSTEEGGFGNVGEVVSASLASDAKIHTLKSNNGWSWWGCPITYPKGLDPSPFHTPPSPYPLSP